MLKILKRLNILLDKKQKKKMVLIVFLMLIGGVLESLSISVIVPVMTVLLDPNAVTENKYLAYVYNGLHMSSPTQFALVMMVVLVLAFVLKNLFLFIQNVIQLKFVYTNQFATSRRMMINFMKRPYEYYLGAETAVIQRNITSDVNNMYALILTILQLTSEVVVFICLVAVLITVDAAMVITIAGLLLAVLLVIKVLLKPIMYKAGQENQDYYSGLFKWIEEAVMGIKEIKVAVKEHYFINEYARCGEGYVGAVQKYNIYNSTPRLLIETICIAGLVGYMSVVMLGGATADELLPQLSVFALAAMRLLPSANRMNNYMTSISYFEPFLWNVSEHLQTEINDENVVYDEAAYRVKKEITKLPVTKEIAINDISYAYPNTDKLIFDHASISIPIGSAVGIVGTSGSGKTTMVDVLLGLLTLKGGNITADGVDVQTNYEGWLKNIGYIPQTIFMIDDSIRKNVAFGYADDEIDDERVWAVLKEAQLDEFVKGLPDGLDTGIGERGIRISGGQRQRIGIARALFEDPEVLILDEATSALDGDTEAAIMDSINRLHGRKTLIIIAHRLQTIEKCDMVYRVENGKISRER
ncbi:MAG: ABC transporter ATP-binding protein/permease [Lachnospiraceae bacterium]|nr:ABC transporter ATP-binding protein/permease [Lachnospiraceae bacterium]